MILMNVSASMNMYVISAGFLTAVHEPASEKGGERGLGRGAKQIDRWVNR